MQLDLLVSYLNNYSGLAFTFANSKVLPHRLLTTLKAKLDKEAIDFDIVHLHGSLSKEEKTGFMEFFTGTVLVDCFIGRGMMATAAADLVVDHCECEFVLIFELPDSLSTVKERSGRGSCDGRKSHTVLVAGLSPFITLVKLIHRQGDMPLDEMEEDKNNNIVGPSFKVSTLTSNRNTKKSNGSSDYNLSRTQRKHLVKIKLSDFRDVMNLFNLNRGCQHRRLEVWSANGELRDDLVDSAFNCGACMITTNGRNYTRHYGRME